MRLEGPEHAISEAVAGWDTSQVIRALLEIDSRMRGGQHCGRQCEADCAVLRAAAAMLEEGR